VSDEQKGITQEPTATPQEGEQGTQASAPEQKAETPAKYQGKSPEELAAMLQEQEKFVGEQAKQIGDLRKQVEQFQSMMSQLYSQPAGQGYVPNQMGFGFQAGQPGQFGQVPFQPGQMMPEATPSPDDIPTVQDVVKIMERREAERQMMEEQRRVTEAQMYLASGKENALKNNPKLYEGIESQVANAVFNSFVSGFIPPYELANPKTWEKAAAMVRAGMGEYDLSKYFSQPSPPPASIPYTERPQTVKPSEEKPTASLTEEQKAFVMRAGFNPEEFAKELAEEKEGGA